MRFKQKQKHRKGLKPAGRIAGLLFILLSAVALATTNASAQTLTTLHSFTGGSDGSQPWAGVIADASGNLYGTTAGGGAMGAGTVFKLTPTGTETVLYSFTGGSDGGYPYAGPIADASGNLYGATGYGGANDEGTVFKLTPTGTETVLYSFTGGSDGGGALTGLIADASGNLYGATQWGGANYDGTVFKLTPTGTETVLYSFTGGSDGGWPLAGLIADASGNLYGTTYAGGNLGCDQGCGVVFELVNSSGTYTEKVLYSFTGGSDGGEPFAGLIADASGNLYGTTAEGGAIGYGTVFKVTPTGSETVLHSFTGGSDGENPLAGLIADASGNLYGTTEVGGAHSWGTVFRVTPSSGTETVLYSFTDGSDGGYPYAGLIADASGNLYGTTLEGGVNGDGTVFKLSGSGFAPPVHFEGVPGTPNCTGLSISTLAHTYGGLAHAAKALGYSSVTALQNAVIAYCGGT